MSREYEALMSLPLVMMDLRTALGIKDPKDRYIKMKAVGKDGKGITFDLSTDVYEIQTPGHPWRFSCTVFHGWFGSKKGFYYLQDGKIYIDIEGFDVYGFNQATQVTTPLYPA